MAKYVKEDWIELVREGTWNGFPYTEQWMNEITASYDVNLLKSPIVFGHDAALPWGDDSLPAEGHLLELRVDRAKTAEDEHRLMGKVGLFKEAAEGIDSGKYYNRSIGWDASYPMFGIPYLIHVALLGATNPASVGMDAMELSFDPKQIIDEVEFEAASNQAFFLARPTGLIWDISENNIRYRIRQAGRFREDTFKSVNISRKEGIIAVIGKLLPEYVKENGDKNSMIMQSILFNKGKEWNLSKAKKWVEGNKTELSSQDSAIKLLESDELIDENVNKLIDSGTIKSDNKTGSTNSLNINSAILTQGGEEIMEEETKVAEPKVKDEATQGTPAPTPAQKPEHVLIEANSSDDLQRKNLELQRKLDEANSKLLSDSQRLNVDLTNQQATLRVSSISTRVQTLEVEGFTVPAQRRLGLVEALSAIPADCKFVIDGRAYIVEDVIIECLKVGGKLKLKGEIDIEENKEPVKYEDLETARLSRKVTNIEEAEMMNDLMAEGKTPEEALKIASIKGGGTR